MKSQGTEFGGRMDDFQFVVLPPEESKKPAPPAQVKQKPQRPV